MPCRASEDAADKRKVVAGRTSTCEGVCFIFRGTRLTWRDRHRYNILCTEDGVLLRTLRSMRFEFERLLGVSKSARSLLEMPDSARHSPLRFHMRPIQGPRNAL